MNNLVMGGVDNDIGCRSGGSNGDNGDGNGGMLAVLQTARKVSSCASQEWCRNEVLYDV